MSNRDVEIMAKTIYGEARGEGAEGMEAVALVIINRFNARKWFTGYRTEYGVKIPGIAENLPETASVFVLERERSELSAFAEG